MCAPAASSSFASRDVIFQVVLGPARVEDVAGVADGGLRRACPPRSTASIETRMFSTQFRQSNTRKTSMPAFAACARSSLHHIVGIVGVADAVGAAQQHLQQQVRHRARGSRQPLPRVIPCRKRMATSKVAPPQHSSENSPGAMRAHRPARCATMSSVRMRVASSDWWPSRIVVSVTSTCVCSRIQSRERSSAPEFVEQLPRAGRWRLRRATAAARAPAMRPGGRGRALRDGRSPSRRRCRCSSLVARSAALDQREQFRRRVDELGRVGVVAEVLVRDQVLEEGEVRRHAADAEFAQRAVHAGDRLVRRRRPGGDLLQQRIVERVITAPE